MSNSVQYGHLFEGFCFFLHKLIEFNIILGIVPCFLESAKLPDGQFLQCKYALALW